ncbi:hypothetical protein KKG72_03730 [bacterium]|nr:hypothetical protein [bacterium]MBU1993802.1 hypothetical protein [bacterium]
MSDVAYAERKIKEIQSRKKAHTFFTLIKRFLKFFSSNHLVKSILVYPEIDTQEKLETIINKLSWAFPSSDVKLYIVVSKTLNLKTFSFDSIQSDQEVYFNGLAPAIQFIFSENVAEHLNTDMILLHDAKKIFNLQIMRHLARVEIMDENYYSVVESQVLQNYFYKTLSQKEKNNYQLISSKNMERLEYENQNKSKAYCFVTGPSFDRYKEFAYEDDSFKIICNSTVKNNDFLEYIKKPDLLVFADPVFHFSPCKYSSTFRSEVLNVYKKYNCFIGVPEQTVPLLLAHYPELESALIGISHRTSIKEKVLKIKVNNFNFPTSKNLWVKSSANILTLYMIPFASSFAKSVCIIGADGREKSEKYFWKHSSSAQFDDLMKTVFNTHPSFFRDRDYEDYYDEHCDFLERQIVYGESKEINYFSMTSSHIPALSKRELK